MNTLTGSRRSELIGDSCSSCRVELSCVGVAINTSPTQLNSTRRRVELCRYKRALTASLHKPLESTWLHLTGHLPLLTPNRQDQTI